jgi:hypothetical protein
LGRLRLRFNQFIEHERDFSSRASQVYGDRNDYTLREVTWRFDTVALGLRTLIYKAEGFFGWGVVGFRLDLS